MSEMHPLPWVSIIVAVRNGERHLAGLGAQLAALTATCDAQVLLVDDGSTDGSGELMRALADRLPRAIYLPTEAPIGVAAARNLGITRASAPYVWFVDCDDSFEPSIVRELHAAAVGADADVAICQADLVAVSGRRLRVLDRVDTPRTVNGRDLLDDVLVGRINGYLWNKLFRRSLLDAKTFPLMTSQSDLAGFIGLLPKIATVVLVDQTLYHHVVNRGSITTSANPDLQNLRRCQQAMSATLTTMGVEANCHRARYFNTKVVRYSICNTAYRLSEPSAGVKEIQLQARQEIGLRDVLSVIRLEPSAGAAVAMLRYAEPMYRRLLRRRWQRLSSSYFDRSDDVRPATPQPIGGAR